MTTTVTCERYVDARPTDPVKLFYWPARGLYADFRPHDAQYVMPRWQAEQFAELLRSCGNVVRLVPEKPLKGTSR